MASEQGATARPPAQLDEALHRRFAERRRTMPVEVLARRGDRPGGVMLYRYDDCSRVLRDPRGFSSASAYRGTIDLVMGRTILSMDEPDHKRHRDLVAHAFHGRALATWAGGVLPGVCDLLIDRFTGAGRADLVAQFCGEYPIRVTARILGLPEEDHADFQRWSTQLLDIGSREDAMAASATLRDYFAGIVEERRRAPGTDLISDLVRAEIAGERLAGEAIFSFLRLLLPAGVETTSRALPSLLHRLLTHPAQLDAVRRDRSLLGPAFEEALRLDVPVVYVGRVAARDVEIGGVAIAAGTSITLCLASANRDEARWADPDRFDIHRPAAQHLSFAAGPHMCLGLHLARLEATVALGVLLDRLPGLRLDPDAPPPALVDPIARGAMPALDALRVVFDAAA